MGSDQRVIRCWRIIRFQSLLCHCLFSSFASFNHLLPVWMALGWFPIFLVILMHLSQLLGDFSRFLRSSLPRPQAFFHSHFSLVNSGMTPGTLTFWPNSNLPQILNKLQWWLVVSFRSYSTVALMKSGRQQYSVLICACRTTGRPWEYQPALTGKPSSVFLVTAYWKLTTNSCFWVAGSWETWHHCELFQFLASQYKLLSYFRLAACDGHGHTSVIQVGSSGLSCFIALLSKWTVKRNLYRETTESALDNTFSLEQRKYLLPWCYEAT